MTNPNKMEAGSELDALIAVEVKGWHRAQYNVCDVWEDDIGIHYGVKGYHPSNNNNQAMEMLDTLRANGWTIFLEGDDESWGCRVQEDGDPHEMLAQITAYSDAPTLPLAACQSALAAIRARREVSA